jgi:hypothetical protein
MATFEVIRIKRVNGKKKEETLYSGSSELEALRCALKAKGEIDVYKNGSTLIAQFE